MIAICLIAIECGLAGDERGNDLRQRENVQIMWWTRTRHEVLNARSHEQVAGHLLVNINERKKTK